MQRPRTTTYMALLLSLSLTTGAILSVGDAQARNVGSTTLHNTVLQAKADSLKSDCLIPGGNQTVLLGALGSGQRMDFGFYLETKEAVDCLLTWQTTEGAPVQIFGDLEQVAGEASLDEHGVLKMEAGSKAFVTLSVTAAEEILQAQTVDLQVTCGGLSGVFRMELQADVPEDPEAEEPEEHTEPEETGRVEVVLPGNPGHPNQNAPTLAQITFKTLSEFALTDPVPVKLEVSGFADAVQIGLEENNLPAMTRYSTDGGQSWYLLYDGGYILLDGGPDGEEPAQWLMLLDFSMTALFPDDPVCLEARAYLDDELAGLGYADTLPREKQERSETVCILRSPGVEAQPELTEIPGSDDPESGLTEGPYFKLPLPIGWAEATEIRYEAQLLGIMEDQTIGYKAIAWDAQRLNAVIAPETGELIVYLGANAPAAGTYRLTTECIYEGICFQKTQTTFFINYSTQSDAQNEEV